jgi:hypothetical protein
VPGTCLAPLQLAAEVGAEDRNRGRSDARHSERMSQGVRLHLREPLDDLSRQPWDALIWERHRNPTALFALSPFDLACLPSQVPGELDLSLEARDVDSAACWIGLEMDRAACHQCFKPHLGLTKQAARDDAVTGTRPNKRAVEHLAIALEPPLAVHEAPPPLVVHEPDFAAERSQTEIGVIDSQVQAMLRARCEHPIRLETALRDQIVDEDADVRLVAPQLQRVSRSPRIFRRIGTRDETLRRGLFVALRAVDLSRQEEPRHALCFESAR